MFLQLTLQVLLRTVHLRCDVKSGRTVSTSLCARRLILLTFLLPGGRAYDAGLPGNLRDRYVVILGWWNKVRRGKFIWGCLQMRCIVSLVVVCYICLRIRVRKAECPARLACRCTIRQLDDPLGADSLATNNK